MGWLVAAVVMAVGGGLLAEEAEEQESRMLAWIADGMSGVAWVFATAGVSSLAAAAAWRRVASATQAAGAAAARTVTLVERVMRWVNLVTGGVTDPGRIGPL